MICCRMAMAWLAGVAAVSCLVGCQTTGAGSSPVTVRDGVFIHLSKGPEDPHAVLMALRMANIMAEDRDVLVYCDIEGINIVLKDAPDVTFPAFESSRAQLRALLDRSVPIYACPGCLKAHGKSPEDLMPRVRVADKEAFFAFTKGRILTLDY